MERTISPPRNARLVCRASTDAHMNPSHGELVTPAPLRVLALALALVLFAPAAALAAPPDPLARGPYTVTTVDPVLMGTTDLPR